MKADKTEDKLSTTAPEQIPEQDHASTTPARSYKLLWLMIFLFGLPNIAAYYFYLNRDNIDLSRFSSNHGHIISPVRQPGDISLKTLEGKDFRLSDLRGKWIMVSIGSSSCAQRCQDNLYTLRQVRKATGESYKRVERLFFLTDTSHIDQFSKLMQDYRGTHVIVPAKDSQAYKDYLQIFSVAGSEVIDGIYFIDPLGNYMMAYPDPIEAKKILKDLTRLLKVSQIG